MPVTTSPCRCKVTLGVAQFCARGRVRAGRRRRRRAAVPRRRLDSGQRPSFKASGVKPVVRGGDGAPASLEQKCQA